jgi:hypothetical protein
MYSLPWCFPLPEPQNNGAKLLWTLTSKTMGQNKSFLFLSCLLQLFCSSSTRLTITPPQNSLTKTVIAHCSYIQSQLPDRDSAGDSPTLTWLLSPIWESAGSWQGFHFSRIFLTRGIQFYSGGLIPQISLTLFQKTKSGMFSHKEQVQAWKQEQKKILQVLES